MEGPLQVCQQGELKGYYLHLARTTLSSVGGIWKWPVPHRLWVCMHLCATVYVHLYSERRRNSSNCSGNKLLQYVFRGCIATNEKYALETFFVGFRFGLR